MSYILGFAPEATNRGELKIAAGTGLRLSLTEEPIATSFGLVPHYEAHCVKSRMGITTQHNTAEEKEAADAGFVLLLEQSL